MEFVNDDENVKGMRETARAVGLTDVLRETRREMADAIAAMERQCARVDKALELLDAPEEGGGS